MHINENETELKLKINLPDIEIPGQLIAFVQKITEKLKRKSLKGSITEEGKKELFTTYYDTSAYDIFKADLAFRVRKDGLGRIATVKTEHNASSLTEGLVLQRTETSVRLPEMPDKDNGVEIGIFKGTEIWKNLKAAVGRRKLFDLFNTRFERSDYIITYEDGTEILMSIDYGWIEAGDKKERIKEIELELKNGKLHRMISTAGLIADIIPVEADNTSKYVRGIRLSGLLEKSNSFRQEEKLEYRIPDGEVDAGSAVIAAIGCCIGNIEGKKDRFLKRPDYSENLHALRVSIRHLRSILNFSEKLMKSGDNKKLQSILKNIIKKTAPLREIDILKESFREYLKTAPEIDSSQVRNILKMLQVIRQYEKIRLVVYLKKSGFTNVKLTVFEWLSRRDILENIPINEYTTEYTTTMKEKIRTALNVGLPIPPDKLHEIRIMIKKLRYVREYFYLPDTSGLKKDKKVSKSIKELQDILGMLNDICVNIALVDRLFPPSDAISSFIRWLAIKEQTLSEQLSEQLSGQISE